MNLKRVFVVLNPVAGTTKPDEVRQLLEQGFRRAGWAWEIYTTTGDEDLPVLVRRKSQQGFDLLVAAGGDGTFSGVASGVVQTEVPLSILPLGTVNTMARELGIPMELEEALDVLLGDHELRAVDGMQVDGGARHFFLNLSLGVSAAMMRDTRRAEKQKMGWVAYLWGGLRALSGFQPARFTLTVDEEAYTVRATDVVVANNSAVGVPEFQLGPDIRLDDGLINVCVIRARSIWDYARAAWAIVTMQQKRYSHLRFFEARRTIRICSHPRLPVQADGDFIDQQSVEIRIVPRAVRVVVPKR